MTTMNKTHADTLPLNRVLRTVPETMKVLRISRSTLYALMASGTIRRTKVGGRTLIADTEIERLLTSGSAE